MHLEQVHRIRCLVRTVHADAGWGWAETLKPVTRVGSEFSFPPRTAGVEHEKWLEMASEQPCWTLDWSSVDPCGGGVPSVDTAGLRLWLRGRRI